MINLGISVLIKMFDFWTTLANSCSFKKMNHQQKYVTCFLQIEMLNFSILLAKYYSFKNQNYQHIFVFIQMFDGNVCFVWLERWVGRMGREGGRGGGGLGVKYRCGFYLRYFITNRFLVHNEQVDCSKYRPYTPCGRFGKSLLRRGCEFQMDERFGFFCMH